jgi:hypothetical protein
MSDTIVWVHDDALSPNNPALVAFAGAPALYVFDDAYLGERRYSLKRVMFIYECLLELPVVVRRGDVAEEVLAFAQEHGAARVVTTEAVGPRFAAICESVRKGLPAGGRLEIAPVEPFAAVALDRLHLQRFTRYWSAVKNLALRK